MSASDGGLVLRTLVQANVQFVVVGEPGAGPLRIVVSRHPTNLEALGRALDAMGASLRAPSEGAEAGLHRVADPSGTLAVDTDGGTVDLLVGGAHGSLYADTLERSQPRQIEGTTVRWSAEPAPVRARRRATGTVLGRRLLSVAEGLTHLMERSDAGHAPGGPPAPGGPSLSDHHPPSGKDPEAGGGERNSESGSAG